MKDVPISDLDDAEHRCILEHNTMKPKGYNLVPGRPDPNKAARYERFSAVAKAFANTDEFRQKKRDLWKDPEWKQAWHDRWMEKRQEKLSELGAKERLQQEHEYVRADRTLARRQAKKNDETWTQWQQDHSKDAGMKTKNTNLFKKRVKHIKTLSVIDGHEYMLKSTLAAIKKTRKSSATRTFEDVQKWFPNTLTQAEIDAVRANGGHW